MQCTKQEDQTDPLYLWTGGFSCPQSSQEENTISGTAKEEREREREREREMNPTLFGTRNRPPKVY